MMSIFHLLPDQLRVVATGQAGNSSLVSIKSPFLLTGSQQFKLECYIRNKSYIKL